MKITVYNQKSTYAYKTLYTFDFIVIDRDNVEHAFSIHSVLWQMKEQLARVMKKYNFTSENIQEIIITKLVKDKDVNIVSYSKNYIELKYFLHRIYFVDEHQKKMTENFYNLEKDLSTSFISLVKSLHPRYTSNIPYLEELDPSATFI